MSLTSLTRIKNSNVGSVEINTLTDVDTNTTPPADGETLVWDAASQQWLPGAAQTVSAVDDLTDVVITSPSNGQVLKYNAGTGNWVNATDATGGGSGGGGGASFEEILIFTL